MDKNKLKAANDLESRIEKLKKHLDKIDHVLNRLEKDCDREAGEIRCYGIFYNDQVPIGSRNLKMILLLHKQEVVEEISKLEREFDEL